MDKVWFKRSAVIQFYEAENKYLQVKSNTKALTEALGREIIEIGAPVKDLPADLEEEPSVENDDDITSTTIQVATKEDIARAELEKPKDIDKIDGVNQDDEEARIEKELAEIYKDSSDYKSDSSEMNEKKNSTDNSTDFEEKPVARMRANFKFQPNTNSKKDIELFRTSVDDISCEKNKLSGTTSLPNGGYRYAVDAIIIGAAITSLQAFNYPLLV
ncbi:uncharacterized protein LOC119839222 [Zerene cesonia]|uniref:uncharacterized protein LOC119839222 n=1 Tax=Zerene cesonia TaxID=33412 RepID=UPI0018E551F7|nr:uncharacterized protein LOC119839222 [Zerene cesonia]